MTWSYRVCKETYKRGKEDSKVIYSVREAYMNEDGGIWGVTRGGVNLTSWIEDEVVAIGNEYESDSDIQEAVILCLFDVINDCLTDVLDLDNFEFADTDFDLDEMINDNQTLQ